VVFPSAPAKDDRAILPKSRMRADRASILTEISDAEFVAQLRVSTQGYLQAVDAWEAAYQKYYRLASPGRVSPDLEPLHQEYLSARKRLKHCVPRARRLCLKYTLRDPWPAILHINLGSQAPQSGAAPAIGRAERALLAQCLDHLQSACEAKAEPYTPYIPESPPRPRGILQRIIDYFV
jgi:hypothetical protein